MYIGMRKRTTIELDQDLLERARRALGSKTTRATVEEALRRAAELAESESERRAAAQAGFFAQLADMADLDVMASEEMWR
jgi:Arc/MetJ family transcription regulator